MHLKLISCGSKQPANLSIIRLAHSQAKPAGSSLCEARRRALPSPATRVCPILARCLSCVFENVYITIAAWGASRWASIANTKPG